MGKLQLGVYNNDCRWARHRCLPVITRHMRSRNYYLGKIHIISLCRWASKLFGQTSAVTRREGWTVWARVEDTWRLIHWSCAWLSKQINTSLPLLCNLLLLHHVGSDQESLIWSVVALMLSQGNLSLNILISTLRCEVTPWTLSHFVMLQTQMSDCSVGIIGNGSI